MHTRCVSNDAADQTLPSIADAPALPVVGEAPRKRVWSWALWDWATQPFNSVLLTFVFVPLYLTSEAFIDPEIAALGTDAPEYQAAIDHLTEWLGWGMGIAGFLIAIVAPVLGQRADARARRKTWLGIATILLVLAMVGLFFVKPVPDAFMIGVALMAFGSIVSEIAGVNYNAMIVQVSTPKTLGRVSGLGWGLGYVGGIVALVIIIVLQQMDMLPAEDGLGYRLIAVGSAIWVLLFAWPLFLYVPEAPASDRARVSLIKGYAILWNDLKKLWHTARATLWFLLASAVYRDGLAGVFTFGAVIAAAAYGFEPEEVIIFGIAANMIAGISTVIGGRLDDRIGPRRVILVALGVIVVTGSLVAFLHEMGTVVFWIGGLLLSAMVGPAQSASRSLLARLSPEGKESEIFGLYATTGRAASPLSGWFWAGSIAIFGATIWGTLGIVLLVAIGFVLMLFVKTPADRPVAARTP